ncbi:MAG TPA: redoxin family protein [Solirubrobacteraceae bacterium]|jgi:peroxiredoxin
MERLLGVQAPSLRLRSSSGFDVDLPHLAASPLLLCLFPGDNEPPGDGAPPSSCAVQRASLRKYALDFAALGVRILGVSSEPHELQSSIVSSEQLPFMLLSDGDCKLADALELPTFDDFGLRRYRRLTMIFRDEKIIAAFYPVSPRRAAVQALVWLQHKSSE